MPHPSGGWTSMTSKWTRRVARNYSRRTSAPHAWPQRTLSTARATPRNRDTTVLDIQKGKTEKTLTHGFSSLLFSPPEEKGRNLRTRIFVPVVFSRFSNTTVSANMDTRILTHMQVNWLMDKYDVQVNKTSRNSVLFRTHIGTTSSATACLTH